MGALIGLVLSIIFIALEYVALCHLATESNLSNNSKKGWILGFVLIGFVVTIIYLLTEYRKIKNENMNFTKK